MMPVFFDYCSCGALSNGLPHGHAERMRKFWEARIAKNPPPKFNHRPPRSRREMSDA